MTTTTPSVGAHYKQQKARPVYWYDWRNEILTHPSGETETVIYGASDILDGLLLTNSPKITVYILAGETNGTAPPHAWYTAPLADGWAVRYRQEQPPLRTATYTRPDRPGVEIQFRHTSAWFRTATNLDTIRRAYTALEKRLRRDWDHDEHVVLLGSPAQTGLDLLARSLPKDRNDQPYRYPLPEPELWELLHTYAYQHRLEITTLPELDTAPGYYYLDGRFAYAAHCRNVPCWPIGHDFENEFSFYGWGFYHITARVPRGWSHLGIFKQPGELAWPNKPGQMVTTWADSHEIKTAIEQGWDLQIHERYLYASSSSKRPGADPLKTWNERLVKAYVDTSRAELGAYGPLLKEACGHLVYDTIGTFKRSSTIETVYVPRGEDLPASAVSVTAVPGGFEAKVERPLSEYQLRWALVHWWAAITHKQRRHLMRRVFKTPREHVAALRTDAAHLLAPPDPAVWVDNGRVGEFRVKGKIEHEVTAPHDEAALFALMKQAV